MNPSFSKQDEAMQTFLHWVMDGQALTSEAERELHHTGRPRVSLLAKPVGRDGRAVARTGLDVAA